MGYVISKSPDVRINLMVKQEYQAEVVSYCTRMHCRYKKERIFEPGNGETWVTLVDVEPEEGGGRNLGELIGLFYSLEWQNLTEGKQDKFYIVLGTKREKGRKKHARKNRQKTGQRGESGDAGESDSAV